MNQIEKNTEKTKLKMATKKTNWRTIRDLNVLINTKKYLHLGHELALALKLFFIHLVQRL